MDLIKGRSKKSTKSLKLGHPSPKEKNSASGTKKIIQFFSVFFFFATILKMNLRCIISLVFILKLGKIVIVKEENSPWKWRVFLCLLFY